MKFLKTTETATVNNYPYGSLRATVTFSTEWKKGKGFRLVFQSINPKNGRLNAPKKTTYYPVIILTQDEKNYVKGEYFGLNGTEEINKATPFLAAHFDLFTPEQIKEIYVNLYMNLRATFQAQITYCGAKAEDVAPVMEKAIQSARNGLNDGGNLFSLITIDEAALKACEVKDYNPFKIN